MKKISEVGSKSLITLYDDLIVAKIQWNQIKLVKFITDIEKDLLKVAGV